MSGTLGPADELTLLRQRAERERVARKQAEVLLEQKSLELYQASVALRASRDALEARVAERTQELAAANVRLESEARDRTLMHRAAALAAETDTAHAALQEAVELICAHTGWPVGHVYLADARGDHMVPSGIWCVADPVRYRAFRDATANTTFPISVGLPGRILASGEPAWIVDVLHDANFPRGAALQDGAIHGAFGFPVCVRGRTAAVLEFFTDRPMQCDDRLLALMRNIGEQVGRVLERRQGEQALAAAKHLAEAASQAKSEFLANMSHEIRTPMTAILGYADELAERVHDPAAREAVAVIQRNGNHLLTIINDILDLSKIEAGRLGVERVAVPLVQLVSEVVSAMKVRADAKGLRLAVEWRGPVPPTIDTDPTRLKQVLINLLGNAIKFTELGAVRFGITFVADPSPRLQFDVVDIGIGMTPEQAQRLFQPFSQADSATTRRFGGTGLGLAISLRLAQLLGGAVRLVSTQLHVGTHFEVWVPTGAVDPATLLEAPSLEAIRSQVDAPTLTEPLACRVLLAEDGPDNQRLISHILRKAGATVTVVENGQLAIDQACAAQARGTPFDVLLTDIQMPVLDGHEVARQLRARGYTGRIVALTAHAMDADRAACLAAGCDDFDTKPIDRARLLGVIRQQLQIARGSGSTTRSG